MGTFEGLVTVQSLGGIAAARSIRLGAPVNQVSWSPDGTRIAAATYSGAVHLLLVPDGRLDRETTIQAHQWAVKSVAWLDDATFVTGATDRLAKVISIAGDELQVLSGHGNLVNAVSVASAVDRPLIASASRDRTVRVWDPWTGLCERVLLAHDESVKSVSWKPGSAQILLSGSYDYEARVWNLGLDEEDESFSVPLRRHRNGVGAVTWWRGYPVTASWDTACIVWRVDADNPETMCAISLAESDRSMSHASSVDDRQSSLGGTP
jgi:WD40 repeat protein